jgi:hypothetical protein
MSFCYAVEAILSMPCNRGNVLKIFEKGKQLDVIFFNNLEDNDFYNSYQGYTHLSPEKATEAFFVDDYDPFVGRLITARMEGVCFSIKITAETEHTLLFSLLGIGLSGEKRFSASEHGHQYAVDFDRYIRFLLRWCNDFPMLSFSTSTY